MKTTKKLLMALGGVFSATVVLAGQFPGTPAAGGKGPGMGHDYRRNVGGPGPGATAGPSDSVRRDIQQSPATDYRMMPRPTTGAERSPGLGYPGYPLRDLRPSGEIPAYGMPYVPPRYGYGNQRGRRGLGYGYPGYRGQGRSPYPRHRQYGNPPGIPGGPAAAGAGN